MKTKLASWLVGKASLPVDTDWDPNHSRAWPREDEGLVPGATEAEPGAVGSYQVR